MADPTNSVADAAITDPSASVPLDTTAMIAASAVSLPAFWPSRTELWFALAEAKFDLAHPKITQQQTKFNHVLTVLPPEVANEVVDLITKPDRVEPYTKLKQAIIDRTTLSDSQKLKQLLSGEELGSRKPSQLLRNMRQLVADSGYVNDQALNELFLQQMPMTVKPILVSLTGLTLEQKADIADRILETTIPTVAAITQPERKQKPEVIDPMTALTSKLDSIINRLDDLENPNQKPKHRRQHSRTRSRSRTPGPGKRRYCWYHFKFGDKAEKCTTPCGYSTEEKN